MIPALALAGHKKIQKKYRILVGRLAGITVYYEKRIDGRGTKAKPMAWTSTETPFLPENNGVIYTFGISWRQDNSKKLDGHEKREKGCTMIHVAAAVPKNT